MDTKPFMSEFGFGRAGSRHIIVEQNEKLWLAFASEGAGVFMMSSDSLSAGLLEINLMYDGQSVTYTYEASESLLEISSKQGKVTVAVDSAACALRFEGEGVSLRLDSTDTDQPTTNLNMPGGTAVSMGGGRYFFVAKHGKISFDDTWIRDRFRSAPPVLDIAPEGGKFELVAYDLPADNDVPLISKSISECAAENAADFKNFCDSLVSTPPQFDDVRKKIAYLMWANQRNINNVNVILSNKLRSAQLDARKLSIASLTYASATCAAQLATAGQSESPAGQASAILRLFRDGLFNNVSRKTVFELYETLRSHLVWWTKNRTNDDPSLYFYAYRYEAETVSNALFKSGAPVYSPDINACMILACKALAELAEFLGNTAEAEKWRDRASAIRKTLIMNLWNGESFIGKNVYSSESVEADAQISLAPMALGDVLPKDITDKLAASIDDEVCDPFIIIGLHSAGYEEQAKQIVSAKLAKARDCGVNDPYDGAALLALAHYVQ